MSLSIVSLTSPNAVHVKCVLLVMRIKVTMPKWINGLENIKKKGENAYKEILGYEVVLDSPILRKAYEAGGTLNGHHGCLLSLITPKNTSHFLTKIGSSNFSHQSWLRSKALYKSFKTCLNIAYWTGTTGQKLLKLFRLLKTKMRHDLNICEHSIIWFFLPT